MINTTARTSESLAARAPGGRHAERACYPSPLPLGPNPCRRRGGFTLVELLVVITIIIILMGLLTPVVINGLTRAKEARILTEIGILDGAFKKYKADVGAYPPSDFSNLGTASVTGGNYNTNSLNTSSREYVALANHLQKAFPRCNVNIEIAAIIVSNPKYPSTNFPAPISPAQAIYFWLGGFCSDKEHPISGLFTTTNNGVVPNPNATRDAPGIDFDKTRLTWPNSLPTTTAPCYCPVDTPGVPYIYFSSQSYLDPSWSSTKPVAYLYDAGVWLQGGSGKVRPYAADPVVTAPNSPAPVQQNGFQIISAGLDSDFGGGGVMDDGKTMGNPVVAYFNSGTFYATGDKDNLTNFSSNTLGDSIPR
jgi:prepilin-type N-terminal cleavage/methylation domain-containing protein